MAPTPVPQQLVATVAVRFEGSDLRTATASLAPGAVRDLYADAMAYDRQRDQLLVAPSAAAGSTTLLGLSPLTLQTAWSIDLPAAATTMAIADDSSVLYVGLANGTVRQYELSTRRLVREIELTEGRDKGYYPTSLSVRPGNAGTVAVSAGRKSVLGLNMFDRLAVWQDGVKWPQTLEVGPVLNNKATQVIFADADTLLSLDTEDSARIMLRIPVQGQMLAPQFPGISTCCDENTLQRYNGRVLLEGGNIVDPATLRVNIKPYGMGGFFTALADQGTLSEVSVQSFGSSGEPGLVLSEYASDRFTLKRRAVFAFAPLADGSNYSPELKRVVDAGQGRVALQIDDAFHKRVKLMVFDLGAVEAVATPKVVTQPALAQDVSVLSVTMPLSGMAYDRQRDRLVGIIGPEGGPIGNSLVVLRPADGSIEARYPLSSQPGQVTVSGSGSVAYVTLPEENGFQRVDVGAAGALGWRVTGLQRPVTSLAISPAEPDTVAVVQAHNVGFTVYRAGAVVSQSPEAYMSDIAFNGPREIVVVNQKTTENNLSRYAFDGPTAVLNSSSPKPLWQGFGQTRFQGDTMQDGYSYASLATGKRIGWILSPEGRVMPLLNIPEKTYGAVDVWDSAQGFGANDSSRSVFEVDYLNAQAGAQGGTTDLIGSRRLQITDLRWPQPPILLGDRRTVVATGPHSAVVARSVGSIANTTLYFIKGL